MLSTTIATCWFALLAPPASSNAPVAKLVGPAQVGPAQGSQAPEGRVPGAAELQAAGQTPANPFRLEPFHADFPVELQYPPMHSRDYDRSRSKALAQVVANLQGGRRDSWLMAREFFWHAPEDVVEPLVEAMDAAFGKPALADVLRNCIEAMGMMGNDAFDAALRRALEHTNSNVRQAALCALATSGKEATLRALLSSFTQMDARARDAWLRAVRTRLGDDAIPILRDLMLADLPLSVRDQILKETLQLPPAKAAQVLQGRWRDAVGEFKPIIAGVLHGAGDGTGTLWLREALEGTDLAVLMQAIKHCVYGDLGPLRDPLLRLSSHPRADVRFELAKALLRLEGPDATAVFEMLAGPEEPVDTRSLALRELTRRGRPETVGGMLAEVPTATGVRMQVLLHLLSQSGDERAVPLFVERFRNAPVGEGRQFLQSLAALRNPAATAALLDLFRGPERLVDRTGRGEAFTTINYIPTMLLNLRGSEAQVVAAFRELPPEDWRRRAALLPTIVGIASDREDAAIRNLCLPVVREILFDRTQLPQLRVLALNLLTSRFVTIDDAMQLKRMRFEETPAMRTLLTDYLHTFF